MHTSCFDVRSNQVSVSTWLQAAWRPCWAPWTRRSTPCPSRSPLRRPAACSRVRPQARRHPAKHLQRCTGHDSATCGAILDIPALSMLMCRRLVKQHVPGQGASLHCTAYTSSAPSVSLWVLRRAQGAGGGRGAGHEVGRAGHGGPRQVPGGGKVLQRGPRAPGRRAHQLVPRQVEPGCV